MYILRTVKCTTTVSGSADWKQRQSLYRWRPQDADEDNQYRVVSVSCRWIKCGVPDAYCKSRFKISTQTWNYFKIQICKWFPKRHYHLAIDSPVSYGILYPPCIISSAQWGENATRQDADSAKTAWPCLAIKWVTLTWTSTFSTERS